MTGRPEDAHRLADTLHTRHGAGGSRAVREAWYALYVALLIGGLWGFSITRGLLLQVDRALLDLADPRLWAAAGLVVVLALGLVRRVGRIRGPVVPSLPWIDLVVSTSLDRALVLREPWRVALLLGLGGGVIGGGVAGSSAWATGIGGPTWVAAGIGGGAALGWLLVTTWLSGQASTRPLRGGWSLTGRGPRRQIPIEVLREQSARSRLLHGSVLVGDLRAARLGALRTRVGGRALRLRSTGAMSTLVRRDLLGYRRSPGGVLAGLILLAVGAVGIGAAVVRPDLPVAIPLVAAATTYLGCGASCEGLRMQADSAGAPSLLGLSEGRQALAHLVAPLAVSLVVAVSVAATATALIEVVGGGMDPAAVLVGGGWMLVVTLLALSAQSVAAFRGALPVGLTLVSVGPAFTVTWYAVPLLFATAAGGLLTEGVAVGPTWWPVPAGLLLAGALLRRGLGRARDEASAHRC